MAVLPDKDPAATLPYGISWSDWLYNEDDTIVTESWSVPTGITNEHTNLIDGLTERVAKGTLVESSVAVIWLSGGTDSTKYRLTHHIETEGGRTDERSITVPVRER